MRAGERVDRYLVAAELGRGGMGVVFEAVDTRLGRKVALKVIAHDADALANERMLREARAAAAFEHPNAVTVFDVGEAAGSTFLAMELVRGRGLRSFVGDASVPGAKRVRWIVDVARALGAAHRAGLVHRDVKPDNVMVRDDGRVKVLDFGIARRQDVPLDPSAPTEDGGIVALTERGAMVGTPLYASPEQIRAAPLDGRSDQFSWGVLAYELLTGRPPWRLDSGGGALAAQIVADDATPMRAVAPEIPEAVDLVVLRALAKRPGDRFATIDEAADALEAFAEAPSDRRMSTPPYASRPPPATLPSAPPPGGVVTRAPSRALLVGLGCAAVLGLAGVVALVVGVWAVKSLKPVPIVMDRIACADAVVEGEPAGSPLAAAIGHGACARLGVLLGVEWNGKDELDKLTVNAKLDGGKATVTLGLRGVQAEGSGASPFAAVAQAITMLEPRFSAPQPPKDYEKAWGAKDVAGARRIERTLRESSFAWSGDHEGDAKAVAAAEPASAWAQAMPLLVGGTLSDAKRKHAIELTGALPVARANALKGLLLYQGEEADRGEALKLLRLAYKQDAQDPDVAAFYARVALARGLRDEGVGVVERLCPRSPSRCIPLVEDLASHGETLSPEKRAAFLDKLFAIAPEKRATGVGVRDLVARGKLTEARAMLELGERLGLLAEGGGTSTRLLVELASFDSTGARRTATSLLGSPNLSHSAEGARGIIASCWIEGRLDDCLLAEAQEIHRQRQLGSDRRAAVVALSHLRALGALGRPIDDDLPGFVAGVLDKDTFHTPAIVAGRRARLALTKSNDKAELGRALEELEASAASAAAEDVNLRDALRLSTIALVRRVRGDAAARTVWAEAKRAPTSLQIEWAFDAALALETGDDPAELARAYELAASPANFETSPLFVVIAHARLGRVYRALGRTADADRETALVDKAWGAADPALRQLASGRD